MPFINLVIMANVVNDLIIMWYIMHLLYLVIHIYI